MKKLIIFSTLLVSMSGIVAMQNSVAKVDKALSTERKRTFAKQYYDNKQFGALGQFGINKQEYEAWLAAKSKPTKNGNGKKNGTPPPPPKTQAIAKSDLDPIRTAAAAVGGAIKDDPAAQAKKQQILDAVEQGLDAGM